MEKRPRRAAEGICLPPPGNWINNMVARKEFPVNSLGRDFSGALCQLGLTVGAATAIQLRGFPMTAAPTIFFRLLSADDKGEPLADANICA